MATLNNDFWLAGPTKSTFKTFFNQNNANKGSWNRRVDGQHVNIRIADDGDIKLTEIFTNANIKLIMGTSDFNVYQFLIMTGIMINETGGKLNIDVGEFGNLKYTFEAIPSVKTSYNCSGANPCSNLGNKSAYDLFHDSTFMNLPARAHMYRPKNINDLAWKGYAYPMGEPIGDTYNHPKTYKDGGIIAECDFYKFRGRGLIQLTGRENYKNWFKYIIDNKGVLKMSTTSLAIVNGWGSDSLDNIATKITNTELDALFSDVSLGILLFKTHTLSNKILTKMYNVTDPNQFVDLTYDYGLRISGSKDYATLFANRIFEIIQNIPGWTQSPNV